MGWRGSAGDEEGEATMARPELVQLAGFRTSTRQPVAAKVLLQGFSRWAYRVRTGDLRLAKPRTPAAR